MFPWKKIVDAESQLSMRLPKFLTLITYKFSTLVFQSSSSSTEWKPHVHASEKQDPISTAFH
jgi:hypothetical protein